MRASCQRAMRRLRQFCPHPVRITP
jgi:hypothetical protein